MSQLSMMQLCLVYWNPDRPDERITFHTTALNPVEEILVPHKGINFPQFCEEYCLLPEQVLDLYKDNKKFDLAKIHMNDMTGMTKLVELIKLPVAVYIYIRNKTRLPELNFKVELTN